MVSNETKAAIEQVFRVACVDLLKRHNASRNTVPYEEHPEYKLTMLLEELWSDVVIPICYPHGKPV